MHCCARARTKSSPDTTWPPPRTETNPSAAACSAVSRSFATRGVSTFNSSQPCAPSMCRSPCTSSALVTPITSI
ncbi:MAG: hypothetical protein ACK55Z_27000 [bacterium]